MTRAIAIGECMVELRPLADGRLQRSFAGDAYNTAVYLKRSAPQIDVAFLSVTGDDALSAAMRQAWAGEGIDDRLAFRIAQAKPALYLIETDAGGDRRFHYWRGESPARQWFKTLMVQGAAALFQDASLVYVSGISLAILPDDDRAGAIAFLGTLAATIAFDPNIRPALWSTEAARACFGDMMGVADILLPSRQDVEILSGRANPNEQMAWMAALTGAEIALTADEAGCLVRDGDKVAALRAVPAAQVVDTSGAGDSFNGAYLAARLLGKTPFAAAADGLRLAATVVAEPGAIIARLDGRGT